jgi:hypothetical protein
MTMEELFRERKVFKDKVIQQVQSELEQFGLCILLNEEENEIDSELAMRIIVTKYQYSALVKSNILSFVNDRQQLMV